MRGIIYPILPLPSSGGAIDDENISPNTTFSSQKIMKIFESFKTPTPIVTLPEEVDEKTNITITIDNYIPGATYLFQTDGGIISYTGGNTATLQVKEVAEDTPAEVRVRGIQPGYLISSEAIKSFTIKNVPYEEDVIYSNDSFQNNYENVDGFDF
ncbi:MAG: hypothetical protein C6I01_01910 [Epsilonproteobacteria bacterium]|nr:hypothetical protein [Campylobacterota bacterium]